MRILSTPIPDLLVFEPVAHRDERGFFMETWRGEWREALGLSHDFVQENHARSESSGVVRGLHFQLPPHTQGKLLWVVAGSVYDVAVDLRKGSPSYGRWHGLALSAANALRFWVPRGFAHGYMTLEPGTEVQYKVDAYYAPASEGGIRWDDPSLAVPWPDIPALLSSKDKGLPLLEAFDSPFIYRKKR